MVRARAKIGLANLAYNFTRLAWLRGKPCRRDENSPQPMAKTR
jgi:hypothetical protein